MMDSSFNGNWFFGKDAYFKIEKATELYRSKSLQHSNQATGGKVEFFSPFLELFKNSKIQLNDKKKINNIMTDKYVFNILNECIPITKGIDLPPINLEKTPLCYGAPNSGNYEIFENALTLIQSNSYLNKLFQKLIVNIVPINVQNFKQATTGVGFSLQKHLGAIFLSEPLISNNQHIQLAISFAHELGHQALMIYQAGDTVINKSDLELPIYSHARKCDRPTIQALHACVAIAFMCYFLNNLDLKIFNELELKFIETKKDELNSNLKESVELFFNTRFTDVGKQLHLELLLYANTI